LYYSKKQFKRQEVNLIFLDIAYSKYTP